MLTATFLALAAGSAAACDSATPTDDGDVSNGTSGDDDGSEPAFAYEEPDAEETDEPDVEEAEDEVFYCADEDGQIVDEDNCDQPDTPNFFLWHSPGYPRGLSTGTQLDGGDYFAPGDRASRRAFRLPATGRVSNGTVKTNVVGRSSTSGGTLGSSGG